jgi:hypothetical protein
MQAPLIRCGGEIVTLLSLPGPVLPHGDNPIWIRRRACGRRRALRVFVIAGMCSYPQSVRARRGFAPLAFLPPSPVLSWQPRRAPARLPGAAVRRFGGDMVDVTRGVLDRHSQSPDGNHAEEGDPDATRNIASAMNKVQDALRDCLMTGKLFAFWPHAVKPW